MSAAITDHLMTRAKIWAWQRWHTVSNRWRN